MTRCKAFALIMAVITLSIIAFGVCDLIDIVREREQAAWRPTEVYPMANAHVSWNQTYYGGAW